MVTGRGPIPLHGYAIPGTGERVSTIDTPSEEEVVVQSNLCCEIFLIKKIV